MSVSHKATTALLFGILSSSALLSACQTAPFGHNTASTPRYEPTIVLGAAQTLTILPTRVACESALPMQCLLAQSKNGEVFQIPYDWIDDFRPTAGTEYVISARPQIDDDKQQPTGQWMLQDVLSQRAAATP